MGLNKETYVYCSVCDADVTRKSSVLITITQRGHFDNGILVLDAGGGVISSCNECKETVTEAKRVCKKKIQP